MNFSENHIRKKEKEFLSNRNKYIRRFRMDVFFLNLFIGLGLLVVACFCVLGTVRGICDSAPEIGEMELLSRSYPTIVYDKNGNEIQQLTGKESRQTYVPLEQISEAVKNAFIAKEDAHFYEHHGVDIRGIFISLYGDNEKREYKKNNSTLAQKLIRNQIFENENTHSLFQKISQQLQEQYLSVKLESDLGKGKILEYYLNTINFGDNIIGIQEASQFYFDKNAQDLNNSEATVLVAMSQDPELYNPVTQQADNAGLRMAVLGKMLNMGSISEDEYEDALGDDVYMELQGVNDKKRGVSEADSYYVDAVISQVIADLKEKLGYSHTRAYQAVFHSGLKIYTCQDKDIQKICDEQIEQKNVLSNQKQQISFVLLDHHTGNVLALTGGRGEKRVEIDRNRAVDFIREPGNAFALLSTWLPALDTAGLTLGSVEDDSSYEYIEGGNVQKEKRSYGCLGLVTMRESILKSLRIPAIKALNRIHVQTGYDYLQNLGISTLIDKKENLDGNVDTDIDLSMASGRLIQGVSNLELTAAYGTIANGGKYRKPVFYTKVVDRDGNILLEKESEEKTVLKSSTAWLVTHVLTQKITGGEQETALSDKEIQTAGTASVSESNQDFWFEGYTPFYTAGIWCGRDDGGKQENDSSYRTIWKNIMEQVHAMKNTGGKTFQAPSDIVACNICTKCGNLAVEGLCEEAMGGNASRKEYFARGSEPQKSCDCHVKYYICKESGKPSNENCPKEQVESRVFLIKEETQETEDTPYILPRTIAGSSCDVHGNDTRK